MTALQLARRLASASRETCKRLLRQRLHSDAAQGSKVPMFRYAAAAALTAAAGLLLAACSAGSRPPLVDMKAQEGEKVCFPAPNGAADTPAWNSPVGFALNLYYNASSTPVEVESVTLIDPHNLILQRPSSTRPNASSTSSSSPTGGPRSARTPTQPRGRSDRPFPAR